MDKEGLKAAMTHDIETPVQAIDCTIYVMPAFATLEVADLEASKRWYTAGLGFIVLAELPGPGGAPGLVHLRRWHHQDLLLVPARGGPEAARGTGVRLSFAAGDEDLNAIAQRASGLAGGWVEGPMATPWQTIDLVCHDPDGYVVVFTGRDLSRPPDPQRAAELQAAVERARYGVA